MRPNQLYKLLYFSKMHKFYKLSFTCPHCVILAYHRICSLDREKSLLKGMIVTPDIFEWQMQYIKSHYEVISLDQIDNYFMEREINKKNAVIITFDDGYEDNYQYALPILKKYDLPATIFVPTAFIENDFVFWWDRLAGMFGNMHDNVLSFQYKNEVYNFVMNKERSKNQAFKVLSNLLKHSDYSEQDNLLNLISNSFQYKKISIHNRILSWSQIREMLNYRITFGAHTHTHCCLSDVHSNKLHEEIERPKEILENNLGHRILYYAYPYGEKDDFDARTRAMLIQSGYKSAVTMMQGFIFREDDKYMLRRIGIGGNDTREIFKLKLNGLIPFKYKNLKRNIIDECKNC